MKPIQQRDLDAIKASDSVTLMERYQSLRYCEVSMFPYGCVVRNEVGRELISRGITEVPNIFGGIPIRTDWSPL